jgi:4-hydroxy-3-polyprenylbenzoate decarboxylase
MLQAPARKRLVVAITGASGAIFGIRLLERARDIDLETHLIISAWGARTIEHETEYRLEDVRSLAEVVYRPNDLGAAISSGSFRTSGMVVAPCSMKTLAAISSGMSGDLTSRAADVVLKERLPLVLMVRESPLNEIHLENMLRLSRMGVSIFPPVPSFYNAPSSVEDIVDYVVTRALDQVGFESAIAQRWNGELRRG